MEGKLERVEMLDKYFLERLEDYDDLSIYKFQDFDINWLKKLVDFGREFMGAISYDVFSIVFQLYYRNVFILKEDKSSDIVGLAAFSRAWDDDTMIYLSDFARSKEASGKSLGSEFLKLLIKNIEKQGFKSIRLTVSPKNSAALALDEKAKFVIIDKVLELYGPDEDRYIMELRIKN